MEKSKKKYAGTVYNSSKQSSSYFLYSSNLPSTASPYFSQEFTQKHHSNQQPTPKSQNMQFKQLILLTAPFALVEAQIAGAITSAVGGDLTSAVGGVASSAISGVTGAASSVTSGAEGAESSATSGAESAVSTASESASDAA